MSEENTLEAKVAAAIEDGDYDQAYEIVEAQDVAAIPVEQLEKLVALVIQGVEFDAAWYDKVIDRISTEMQASLNSDLAKHSEFDDVVAVLNNPAHAMHRAAIIVTAIIGPDQDNDGYVTVIAEAGKSLERDQLLLLARAMQQEDNPDADEAQEAIQSIGKWLSDDTILALVGHIIDK